MRKIIFILVIIGMILCSTGCTDIAENATLVFPEDPEYIDPETPLITPNESTQIQTNLIASEMLIISQQTV